MIEGQLFIPKVLLLELPYSNTINTEWRIVREKHTQRIYYWNTRSMETSWTKPCSNHKHRHIQNLNSDKHFLKRVQAQELEYVA